MILIANKEGSCGVETAFTALNGRKDGLRAIIDGIKCVEKSLDIHTVGRGGWPDLLGDVTLDASVIDGDSLQTGAVGALKNYLHPVEVAYAIMRQLDHEILVGDGAQRFAAEINAEPCDNLTEQAKTVWHRGLEKCLNRQQLQTFPEIRLLDIAKRAQDPEKVFDTTVYLSRDCDNKISSATSTSGWAWKYPGRLGDSPVIGAGNYADSRYGACACTHTGEMTIRAGTARSVVLYMKMGMSVAEAVREAVADLRHLKQGYLGEVTIHAIDAHDKHSVVSFRGAEPVYYWLWTDNMPKPELFQAERLD
ncbi:MAG: isoaspartyl peptidase/L-asparaginase [Pseudomonadota bacterium]